MTIVPARFRIDLLLLLVAVFWGSTYFVAKELVSTGTVLAMLSVRMVLAAGALALIIGARRQRLTRSELQAGIPIGVLLAAVFAFETFGVAETSATNAGIIISLTMIFTPVLESMASRRPLPGRFYAAAIIAVAGIALLAGKGTPEPTSVGDLLVLIAAVLRAVHVVSMHRLSRGRTMNSLNLTTVQLGTCAVLFTVASMIYGDNPVEYVASLDARRGAMMIYLVAVCTVFAFFIQIWAVRRTSPSRVSLLLGTEPVWAVLIGVLVARDTIELLGFLGIALVLAGTAWGRVAEQRHRQASPAATRERALSG